MTNAQSINFHFPLRRMSVGRASIAELRPDACRMSDVVGPYRAALQRLVGKRSYGTFELLILRSVSDAVVSLRRHGIGNDDACVALAARHALDCIEQRADAMNVRSALPDEGEAIDALLRVHDHQLCSERLTPLLLGQAKVRGAERGPYRAIGRRCSGAMGRQRADRQEGAHG